MNEIFKPNLKIGNNILRTIEKHLLGKFKEIDKQAKLICMPITNKIYGRQYKGKEYLILPLRIQNDGISPAWNIKIELKLSPEKKPQYSSNLYELKHLLPKDSVDMGIELIPNSAKNKTDENEKITFKFFLKYEDFFSRENKDYADDRSLPYESDLINIKVGNEDQKSKTENSVNQNICIRRGKYIDFVVDRINESNDFIAINLYGQKGIGKTTLLKSILSKIEAKTQFISLDYSFLDVRNIKNSEHLLKEIMLYGINKIAIKNADLKTYQKRIYDTLQTKRLVIMFDDFDIILERFQNDALFKEYLKFLYSLPEKKNAKLILLSREKLNNISADSKDLKIFLNSLFSREIEYFSYNGNNEDNEIFLFFSEAQKLSKLKFDNDTLIPSFIKLTAGHPGLLQLLYQKLIEHTKQNNYLHPIDFWDAANAAEEILNHDDEKNNLFNLQDMWNGLSNDEKSVLLILNQLIEANFLGKVKLIDIGLTAFKRFNLTSDVTKIISGLLSKKIIEDNDGNYIFKLGFLQKIINNRNNITKTN